MLRSFISTHRSPARTLSCPARSPYRPGMQALHCSRDDVPVAPLNLAEPLAPGMPSFDHVLCLEVREAAHQR